MELLVVMAILVVLTGLLTVGLSQARTTSRKLRAREDIGQIATALNAYHSEYDTWPTLQDNSIPAAKLSPSELDALYQMLSGKDRTLDATGTGVGNPKNITFLRPKASQFKTVVTVGSVYRVAGSAETNWVDPWDTSYMIVLDSNGDNQNFAYGNAANPIIKGGFSIWSAGPDQQVDETEPTIKDSIPVNKDNVSSWKQ